MSQALAFFSPDHVTPLLELLIAVIDQDRPAVEQQESKQYDESPPASLSSQPSVQSPPKLGDGDESRPRRKVAETTEARTSDSKAGTAVHRVSCTYVGTRADGRGKRGVAAGTICTEARRELLQRACLRLFVTGMDLFFPSCAQRCSLLARYLSKYLRCAGSIIRGLSQPHRV